MTELYRGKFLGLYQTGRWEYCSRTNASAVVVIVARTVDGHILFTEQYRPPVGSRVIEFPAGLVGDEPGCEDEPLETAAIRELEEECGYLAQSMTALTAGPTSAGLTNELIYFFNAVKPIRTGGGGGVGAENITVHEVPQAQCHSWLEQQQNNGLMVDPKVYAGLYFLSRTKGSSG
ncbi:MAG: NUDIX hydrolase [Lysobacterales bacterium]